MLYKFAFPFRRLRLLCWKFVDQYYGPSYLRSSGVTFGRRLRLAGMPQVLRHPEAAMVVGDDVELYSRPVANVLFLAQPCVLAATQPGSRLRIGNGVGISGSTLVAHTSITIGNRVLVGAGVMIIDTDFHPLNPQQRAAHQTAGAGSRPIMIGDDVFIGARAIILKGVTIGDGAVVGAGAVVASDVAGRSIVAGNPARQTGSIPGI
jgi:acetyltransferase-like isoleucine patch superfamily enzyme